MKFVYSQCHVTAEAWRDAVPAATPRDITQGRPTDPLIGVVKVTRRLKFLANMC